MRLSENARFFALAMRCAVPPLRGGFPVFQALHYTQKIILGGKRAGETPISTICLRYFFRMP